MNNLLSRLCRKVINDCTVVEKVRRCRIRVNTIRNNFNLYVVIHSSVFCEVSRGLTLLLFAGYDHCPECVCRGSTVFTAKWYSYARSSVIFTPLASRHPHRMRCHPDGRQCGKDTKGINSCLRIFKKFPGNLSE